MIQTLNDSSTARRVANMLAALASGGFALAALGKPKIALPAGGEVTPLSEIYTQLYSGRAVAISAVVLLSRGNSRQALLVAGLSQVADALIGLRQRNPGMVAGSTLGALVHLASARRSCSQ